VVDDLPVSLSALSDTLSVLGLQVQALDDPQAALRLVQAEAAAGRASTCWCWTGRCPPWTARPPCGPCAPRWANAPPALLVTAFNEEDLRQQAGRPASPVLVKPITPSDLMDAMAQPWARPHAAGCARPAPTGATWNRRGCGGTMAASASCWPRTTPSTRKWPANCCRR
jgi:CheY-like chemotaxis protein